MYLRWMCIKTGFSSQRRESVFFRTSERLWRHVKTICWAPNWVVKSDWKGVEAKTRHVLRFEPTEVETPGARFSKSRNFSGVFRACFGWQKKCLGSWKGTHFKSRNFVMVLFSLITETCSQISFSGYVDCSFTNCFSGPESLGFHESRGTFRTCLGWH